MAVRLYVFDIRDFPADDPIDASSPLVASVGTPDYILHYLAREDRCRSLAGALMVAKVVGGPIVRFNQTIGMNIKPCHSTTLFNLSHDGHYVVLATSEAYSVGIDIMKVQPTNIHRSVDAMLANLSGVFSASEWMYIDGAGNDERLSRFYHLWTAKEAYVKAIGTGLYTEPDSLLTTITRSDDDGVRIDTSHLNRGMTSTCFQTKVFTHILPEHVLTVCVGPVAHCDTSWTSMLEHPNRYPKIVDGDVTVHGFKQFQLTDLVDT